MATLLAGLVPAQAFTKQPVNSDGDGPHGLTQPVSFWGGPGYPPAGSWNATLNGAVLSGTSANVKGQLPYTDPASGNGYVAGIRASCLCNTGTAAQNQGGGGELILCDRLWVNQVSNAGTSAQGITSPTWPARDSTGTTNGAGVYLALELSSGSLLNGTFTVGYTNSGGSAGQTSPSTAFTNFIAGQAQEVPLAAGDVGVRAVSTFTWSVAPGSGTWNLVAYRPVAKALVQNYGGVNGTTAAAKSNWQDAVQLGMPQVYNGSVLYFMWKGDYGGNNNNNVNNPQISGVVEFARG
jgi:hypothetical protein